MIKLYHGTSEHFEVNDCDDLIAGHDGMMHFTPNRASAVRFAPKVVECESDIDLDSLPTLPDLRHWHPSDIAKFFHKNGVLSNSELQRVEAHMDDEARDFDVQEICAVCDTYTENGLSPDEFRHMLEDLAEDYEFGLGGMENANSYLNSLDSLESAREELFGMLIAKGIPAFKYKNRFEKEYIGDEYSVAVIDTDILSVPKPSTPNMSLVTDAVDIYKRNKVMTDKPIVSKEQYQQYQAAPKYTARKGRGRLG